MNQTIIPKSSEQQNENLHEMERSNEKLRKTNERRKLKIKTVKHVTSTLNTLIQK